MVEVARRGFGRRTALHGLLKPFRAERLRTYPVGTRVNSVKNDDPALIELMITAGGVSV
jgi:putative SOS response-associated peptidase YedK